MSRLVALPSTPAAGARWTTLWSKAHAEGLGALRGQHRSDGCCSAAWMRVAALLLSGVGLATACAPSSCGGGATPSSWSSTGWTMGLSVRPRAFSSFPHGTGHAELMPGQRVCRWLKRSARRQSGGPGAHPVCCSTQASGQQRLQALEEHVDQREKAGTQTRFELNQFIA